jgi:hypothetical protein
MKTAKQWAEDLPNNIRVKFLEYLKDDNSLKHDHYWDFRYEDYMLKIRNELDAASISDDEYQ